MEFAKQQSAMTVAVTDSMDSPLAEFADHTLVARSEMESFVDSLVAPLSVINALIVAIGKKKQAEVRDVFNRLEEVWDKFEVYNKFSGQVDGK
jgi:DNA-binding MurR/RpiR family transcriptional regulator